MADTVQQALRALLDDDTTAIVHDSGNRTWREHLTEASAQASALLSLMDHDRPVHVGALLGNTPAMLHAIAGAALGGFPLVGINNTRRGEGLARDILRADCQVLLTDPEHAPLLDGLDLGDVRVFDVTGSEWRSLVDGAGPLEPFREAQPADPFMLIFTSGTSGDPKPVMLPHMMVLFSGNTLVPRFSITSDDVVYLSMPLFHSNAILAGWCVSLCSGAAMAPATFSASRFLDDVRRYGATYMNYVGKPLAYILATVERPDDADNPLRVAFGNEATDRDIDEFGRRFGCTVWDGFGSTEAAIIITREEGTPPGSIGRGFPGVEVYDPATVQLCPPARFDETGALLNGDEAIGELVNTQGAGFFTGYYNDPQATDERLRDGMFWSGDLAYKDADGWIYLAGRTADWMRVDGENFAAAPIERILQRLPQLSRVAVYGVPDEHVGDQIMAAIVLRDESALSCDEFEKFLAAQADLSPKAWPRYVRIASDLPSTATNKILKRALKDEGATPGDGVLWIRDGAQYRAV
ncbi:fatty-acid--CoA ligase FadD1 [Rhodococcus sp. Z13]|uniref:Fatty-acid--CoA ligase FadD1 n=1 Tax=Rhodococcus sacchari TaxID=2962047 RepID=A0ACD4DJG0_9NOCA|nr:fatty-acid--CoA ligase FadD1 [Rhodococcus sp. Z13]UYP20152.1 fatty-acid--CoA ligase FadD1 [Rhodococcus sp. Z13]